MRLTHCTPATGGQQPRATVGLRPPRTPTRSRFASIEASTTQTRTLSHELLSGQAALVACLQVFAQDAPTPLSDLSTHACHIAPQLHDVNRSNHATRCHSPVRCRSVPNSTSSARLVGLRSWQPCCRRSGYNAVMHPRCEAGMLRVQPCAFMACQCSCLPTRRRAASAPAH